MERREEGRKIGSSRQERRQAGWLVGWHVMRTLTNVIPSTSQKLSEESSCLVHWSTAFWVSSLQIRKIALFSFPVSCDAEKQWVTKSGSPQRLIHRSQSLGLLTLFNEVGFLRVLNGKRTELLRFKPAASIFVFETKSHDIAQRWLHIISLFHPPECRDYRHEPHHFKELKVNQAGSACHYQPGFQAFKMSFGPKGRWKASCFCQKQITILFTK